MWAPGRGNINDELHNKEQHFVSNDTQARKINSLTSEIGVYNSMWNMQHHFNLCELCEFWMKYMTQEYTNGQSALLWVMAGCPLTKSLLIRFRDAILHPDECPSLKKVSWQIIVPSISCLAW